MRVLFLSLPDPDGIHVFRFHSAGFGSSFVMPHADHRYDVYPPIYEAYAAAILEDLGHEVSILDCQSPNLEYGQLLQEIERCDPEVIVSRICLPSYRHDLDIVSQVKEASPNVFLVGWGGICKVFPDMVLKDSKLDLLIREVELEWGLPDVIRGLESNDLAGVEGASFRREEDAIHNSNRSLSKDLDVIPLPAYHLLDMKKYVAQDSHYVPGGSPDKFIPFFSVSGSRGCSFNCLYCPYPITYGPWRGRSTEKIADEIEVLVTRYDRQAIWFHDQTFSMIPERTVKLCDDILNRDLQFHWATETRVDRLDSLLLKKMRESGCGRLEIGVETGDPQLLATVGKRGLTLRRIERTVEAIRKEGIIVETNFLVGLPGDSWSSVRKTAEFIKRINPDILTIMIVTPYPGTPLYKIVKENGWLKTNDWSRYTLFEPVFSMPAFSDEDMRKAHSYLYRQYSINKAKREISEAIRNREFGAAAEKIAHSLTGLLGLLIQTVKN